jgi:hypothetical protein
MEETRINQLLADVRDTYSQLSRATEESKGRRDADARELASIQTYGTFFVFLQSTESDYRFAVASRIWLERQAPTKS